MTYAKFIDGLQLRHFSGSEIASYGSSTRGGTRNSLPEDDIWQSIVVPLWLADMAREKLGVSCSIWSSYRSPSYNRAVGGARHSFHMDNCALDLHFNGVSARRVANLFHKWRDAGLWKGGIGTYPSFVHIDNRGRNATW